MRIYVISRTIRGIVHCTVKQVNGGKPIERSAYRLPHANLHSPTGFECGYGGSGPADLAASILADFFDVNARTVGATYRGKHSRKPRPAVALKVVELHQDFKAELIARIDIARGQRYEITGGMIAEWLCKKDNEAKSAAEASEEVE
jgi:hypothetical protein